MVEYRLLKNKGTIHDKNVKNMVGGTYKSIESARKNAMRYGDRDIRSAIYILGKGGTPTVWGSSAVGCVYWNGVRWEYVSYTGSRANVHYYLDDNGKLIKKNLR